MAIPVNLYDDPPPEEDPLEQLFGGFDNTPDHSHVQPGHTEEPPAGAPRPVGGKGPSRDDRRSTSVLDRVFYYGLRTLLVFFLVAAALLLGYASKKGMCRYTEHDSVGITILKNLANSCTLGVLGLVMSLKKRKDCVGRA